MAKKKQNINNLLLLGAAGGGAYYYVTKQQEPKIQGQTISSIFKTYGIIDGISYILGVIATDPNWNTSPIIGDDGTGLVSNFSKKKSIMLATLDKVLEMSAKSRVLFQKIIDNTKISSAWSITGVPVSTINNSISSSFTNLLTKQITYENALITLTKSGSFLNSYDQSQYLTELKDGIVTVLTNTKMNYTIAEQTKNTWYTKVLGVYNSVGNALDDVWKAVKGMASFAISFVKWAPYLVMGLGGVWVYNNFFKGQYSHE